VLEQFLNHIKRNNLCSKEDRILLAVSGGLDSMVMLDLFLTAGFSIGVAHCNFMLRGEESDKEEKFIERFCMDQGIPFYCRRFDTAQYAAKERLSIQVAARHLRYQFFRTISSANHFTKVGTAHHLNDNLETVLMNLVRGTGIDGLCGIPISNGNIIRPLLFASREEINEYAVSRNLSWCEDSSNASQDYQRNILRHTVIPKLKELNPALETRFKDSLERISGTRHLAGEWLAGISKEVLTVSGDKTIINKTAIFNHPHAAVVLWEMIKSLGFSYEQCKSITQTVQSGKVFYSTTHELVHDRTSLIIIPIDHPLFEESTINSDDETVALGSEQLIISKRGNDRLDFTDPWTAYFDRDKITFPLTWRNWKDGDSFVPLGMNNRKKLSDFLIDLKIPMSDKKGITVLESAGEIIWVVGYRISNVVKITDETETVLVVQYSETGFL
jgi:tRNA(Ile)-lysidine synthase